MDRNNRRDKTLPPGQAGRLDPVCDRFEDIWLAGGTPRLEDFLLQVEEADRPALLRELLALELDYRARRGDRPVLEHYRRRFPEFADALAVQFEADQFSTKLGEKPLPVATASDQPQVIARYRIEKVSGEGGFGRTFLVPVGTPADQPQAIGRYRVEKILGEGGFGRVYLAHDDQLNRPVAIKVPHAERITRPEDAEAYLAEARVVASLDHPNIVPVHDVGTTHDGLCYVVSKLIEGCNLAAKIKEARPTHAQAAELVATVAEALHYAHGKGLVHRDVKPDNILLDRSGKAYVADFGLALKEEDFGMGAGLAGTPAYMSPEQARGEGHRVDGRSDIFSLGVVFYEMLAGRQPFQRHSLTALLEQITTLEARPLRQVDDTIPKELERICFKALAKRASERYMTARDMADDLRHFLAQAAVGRPVAVQAGVPAYLPATPTPGSIPTAQALATPPITPVPASSDSRPIKIVPKGLRSFDAHDADFFLELLPGPRDREGLPDSIRFWKTRIEETDPDNTFAVGLIYGPSGCGKSSLVKAGLLPRLSVDVMAVYIEATAEETEPRLLNGLRKRCPALPAHRGLKETLAALRRGQGIPAGKKLLIVLDQLEQWLHALASRERERPEFEQAELVQALRQCDGSRVQCIVMVRDDFWMAATRFMRELEFDLVPGRNTAAADLFDPRHAKRVLTAFGRAFGTLPEHPVELNKEHKAFVEQAVSGLVQEGKVICVRLALFAEMMKGKPWTPGTLREVGGAEGIGATFLEETFFSPTANPKHRLHQKAARSILKALLPESGTDIKGNMRSRAELLAASGYASRSRDFDDLIRILDGEIRLITPTDPEGKDEEKVASGEQKANDSSSQLSPRAARFYQLTHDYLVPSLRNWLTHKQKETRRGRAELLLADRAAVWNARQENRQLPSLSQCFQIRWWTRKKSWTSLQRKMLWKAGRYHAARGAVLALLLAGVTFTGLAIWERVVEDGNATQAAGLVQRLLDAETAHVPSIIAEMAAYRQWADPFLRDENAKAAATSRQKLHARLALLPVDDTQVEYLYGRLLDAQPHEVPVIRDALAPHKDALLDKLWAVLQAAEKGKETQRLRAAAALAKYDAESARWTMAQQALGNDLVAVPAVYLSSWMDSLRPVRTKLLPQLSAIYRDAGRRDVERSLATDILADYAADNPQILADLLMDADEKQFAVIYANFKDRGEQGLPVLTREISKKLPPELPSSDDTREKLAKRQANAAVALFKMKQEEKVWPLLKRGDQPEDPRMRSYLIHRFGPLGADAVALGNRLDEEPDITIKRALILSLGEYGEKELLPAERWTLLAKLREVYSTGTDPGLHAAAEWLLRQWQQEAWLKQVNEEWAKDQEQREKRLEAIKQLLQKANRAASAPGVPPQWYVNTQGQTLVVIPGPMEFTMGSPRSEKDRYESQVQHQRRIGRSFALASKSVTLAQYRSLTKDKYDIGEKWTRHPDLPVVGIDWYMAAKYCNLLSKEENIDEELWCYETDGEGAVTKLKANYLNLEGYRLPTEAEMEYATRAGALTRRYFGETEELLGNYAWYAKNAQELIWPVGTKKPNDFGLFDLQGNCFAWCQEPYLSYQLIGGDKAVEDREGKLTVISTKTRVLRGGSFNSLASNVRSADRVVSVPSYRSVSYGFRVARTFKP